MNMRYPMSKRTHPLPLPGGELLPLTPQIPLLGGVRGGYWI
jgi:hypothetical protein